jgi:D-serine deaminase-like pyridoxal phosphate-dependent protein
LLEVPDCEYVLQNEEHLVVESPAAGNYHPGAELYAMPTHICPTVAMHRRAYVVENGALFGSWEIAARDRVLTV